VWICGKPVFWTRLLSEFDLSLAANCARLCYAIRYVCPFLRINKKANQMNHTDLFSQVHTTAVEAGRLALWYLGGAGYVLKSAASTLLIDPFIGPGRPPEWTRMTPPAFTPGQVRNIDTVLLTHEHDDHSDPIALDAIRLRTDATLIGSRTSLAVAKEHKWPAKRCQTLPHYATLVLNDLRVTAVPVHDPNSKASNGYVIECGRTTLLHCGDGHYFAGFVEFARRWKFTAICVSVGYNPPGKLLYMDEVDAARTARDAKTRMLILQHYDLWQGYTLDPERVKTAASWYCPDTCVVAAQVGEILVIG
jgi:L-ascorbate 6-phosphate lactonase